MADIEQELAKIAGDLGPKAAERSLILKQTVDPVELTNERGKTHGNFSDHARATQELKNVVRKELGYRARRGQEPLTYKQLEAIDMIMHKIGRVLAGDPSFADHWNDIAGYAILPGSDV